MSSRLASFLVQERIVSASRMAEAFQRQVIYGGTLDTILLEMDVLDEPELVEALGRATSLPTASAVPAATEQLRADGVPDWFPPGLAADFGAVPVAVEGNLVRVMVTDPFDRRRLDELGYQLSRSIDPLIVPEHRFAQASALLYGTTMPARLASLARKLQQRSARGAGPGASTVSITDSRSAGPAETSTTSTLAEAPLGTAVRTEEPAPTPPVAGDAPSRSERDEPQRVRAVISDVPMPPPRVPAAPTTELMEMPTPRLPLRSEQPAQGLDATAGQVEPERATREMPSATAVGPLAIDEAITVMEEAEDRDAVFEALCRAARSQASFSALFTVHGEVAVGRLALADDRWLAREHLGEISIPLDRPSAFQVAAEGRAPFLGRVGAEPATAAALEALGRASAPALVVPLVLRERSVALLYADANGAEVQAEAMTELARGAAAAVRAFQRLILRHKSGEPASAPTTSGAQATSPPSGRQGALARAMAGALPAPAAPTVPLSDQTTERLATRAPVSTAPLELESWLRAVLAGGDDAEEAANQLLACGEDGARIVVAHLPGPLRIDRHALRGPPPALAEHGPLPALLARFGRLALAALLARIDDPALEVRYYVTLACGELRAEEIIQPLGGRLFDADAGVRRAAIEALRRCPVSPTSRALRESLRGDLPGPERTRQKLAAEALGGLHDPKAVPRLIELVKDEDPGIASSARRALVEITKQDFGSSRWRWRGWWERHREEPRLEWILEGLAHAEPEVRLSAVDELRELGPVDFGYVFDAPKREREEARRRWTEWWRDHGREQPRPSWDETR